MSVLKCRHLLSLIHKGCIELGHPSTDISAVSTNRNKKWMSIPERCWQYFHFTMMSVAFKPSDIVGMGIKCSKFTKLVKLEMSCSSNGAPGMYQLMHCNKNSTWLFCILLLFLFAISVHEISPPPPHFGSLVYERQPLEAKNC